MQIYRRLFGAYGAQNWWPGDTPFEVMVGAVLTQNTAWTNVERAIGNLKSENLMDANRIHSIRQAWLARLIRPAGYFNVKARRLKNLCAWLVRRGGMAWARRQPTEKLRAELLSINGVGPETADAILLYAFHRPVFVIDAYTRRLCRALGVIRGDEPYESLRAAFESVLEPDPRIYNEYHALIVRHAKERCSGEPRCRHCKVERPLFTPHRRPL
ncbi:MAG: endonuclease III domain-containing protein [Gammaproteobacteria bacterium]